MASEIEEEIEADTVCTTDYFFERVGESVPVEPPPSNFDLRDKATVPSQPLAVSDLRGLLFLALPSSGFCVAATKDVIALALRIKEKGTASSSISSSVQQSSLVQVPLGKVRILALSFDHSTLAASVGGQIHFFSVDSLLVNKGLQPSSTCSVGDAAFIKDVRWRRKSRNSYLLLSDSGKLYGGTVDGPMDHVMDGVDAVEWSMKGSYIALARKETLSILSSKFQERSRVVLPFGSWIDDSNPNCMVKVDSIKWVRSDSIVVGCFQVTEDGVEENYLVQVIKSREGTISDASSKPVVISFYDLFPGFVDDSLPFGSGPYLLLSYLEQFELAITANKKNMDQHIMYLGWSQGEERNDVAIIDIQRDNWLPRIELQENDDDNFILGLCIDKVSCYAKLKVQLGVEEQRELLPHCILICLTLEGKLTMFNVASMNAAAVSPAVASALSDEEEDVSELVPVEFEVSNASIGLGKEQLGQIPLDFQLEDAKKKEIDGERNIEVPNKTDLNPADVNKSPISVFSPNDSLYKQNSISKQDTESSVNSLSFQANGKQKVPPAKFYQDASTEQIQPSGGGSLNLEVTSTKASFPEGTHQLVKDFGMTGTQALTGFGSGTFSLGGKVPADFAVHLNRKELHASVEMGKVSPVNVGLNSLPSVSSQSLSSRKFILSKDIDLKSPLIPSSYTQGDGSENVGPRNTNDVANLAGKLAHSKEIVGASTPRNSVSRLLESGGQRLSPGPGNIESLPSIRSSHVSAQEIGILGSSANHKHYPSKENHRNLPQSVILNSEPNLSKQFGNIKDMTKELDMLLHSIEQPGGFRDVCTVLQKSSVEALEQGIQNLSDKCQMWRGNVDERLVDVQNLLDKTVQVLARKIYIEGIVKQASDNQYWDFWNRQKLSSELELKRRHILKLNEDLTNQLIELERHFNSIELNKFGENGGAYTGKRYSQSRYGSSRQIQSFQSLHNTMSSQLAAAEKLSECLSKQMSMLNIELPSLKQKNVKKELFETIGIPYDASFSSPNVTEVGDGPSGSKFLFSSGSTAAKDKSRGSSVLKGYEQDTARRRRDSLDQSWVSYEPPKTTVKRLLLQESQKPSLSADKERFSSHLLERSAAAQPKDRTTSSTLPVFENKDGSLGEPAKQIVVDQATPCLNDRSQLIKFSGFKSPTLQRNHVSSASQLVSAEDKKFTRGNITTNMSIGKFSSGVTSIVKPDVIGVKENKLLLQSETNTPQTPALPTMVSAQAPAFLKKPSEELNSRKGTALSSSVLDSTKNKPLTMSSFPSSGGMPESLISLTYAVSGVNSVPRNLLQPNPAASKIQLDEKVSSSPTFSGSSTLPSPLFATSSPSLQSISYSTAQTVSSPMPIRQSRTSSNTTADAKEATPISSPFFPFSVPPPATLSFQTPKPVVLPSSSPPTIYSTSESPKTEVQASSKADDDTANRAPAVQPGSDGSDMKPKPSVSTTPVVKLATELQLSKSDVDTATQASAVLPTPSEGEFDTKLTTSAEVSTTPTIKSSTALTSASQPIFSNAPSPAPNMTFKSQSEQPSPVPALFQTQLPTSGSVGGGKTESLDILNTNEDDMDEEAPESSTATALILGSLGGFGLGSIPNPTAPRANPLGGSFGNSATNMTSSPFTMNVPSGELFRPASFNFQSLQPSQTSQPANLDAFSGGFGTGTGAGTPAQAPTGGFGQPAQIGQGQQALGSVLGSFGQSRQLGTGLPGSGFGSPSGFGGGFSASSSAGGFSSAVSGGGFANVAPTGGGFGGLATSIGGFGGLASGSVGFASVASGSGGGFAGAASSGGFGAFSGQGGTGGFSAFGSNLAATGKPPELFTQMRK